MAKVINKFKISPEKKQLMFKKLYNSYRDKVGGQDFLLVAHRLLLPAGHPVDPMVSNRKEYF